MASYDDKSSEDLKPKVKISRRSIFDFSSVEDLNKTSSDLDIGSSSTREKRFSIGNIPFSESYINYAPKRSSMFLGRRYGLGGSNAITLSSKGGSVENLTKHMTSHRKMDKTKYSMLSKSSPDLRLDYFRSNKSHTLKSEGVTDVNTKTDSSDEIAKTMEQNNIKNQGNNEINVLTDSSTEHFAMTPTSLEKQIDHPVQNPVVSSSYTLRESVRVTMKTTSCLNLSATKEIKYKEENKVKITESKTDSINTDGLVRGTCPCPDESEKSLQIETNYSNPSVVLTEQRNVKEEHLNIALRESHKKDDKVNRLHEESEGCNPPTTVVKDKNLKRDEFENISNDKLAENVISSFSTQEHCNDNNELEQRQSTSVFGAIDSAENISTVEGSNEIRQDKPGVKIIEIRQSPMKTRLDQDQINEVRQREKQIIHTTPVTSKDCSNDVAMIREHDNQGIDMNTIPLETSSAKNFSRSFAESEFDVSHEVKVNEIGLTLHVTYNQSCQIEESGTNDIGRVKSESQAIEDTAVLENVITCNNSSVILNRDTSFDNSGIDFHGEIYHHETADESCDKIEGEDSPFMALNQELSQVDKENNSRLQGSPTDFSTDTKSFISEKVHIFADIDGQRNLGSKEVSCDLESSPNNANKVLDLNSTDSNGSGFLDDISRNKHDSFEFLEKPTHFPDNSSSMLDIAEQSRATERIQFDVNANNSSEMMIDSELKKEDLSSSLKKDKTGMLFKSNQENSPERTFYKNTEETPETERDSIGNISHCNASLPEKVITEQNDSFRESNVTFSKEDTKDDDISCWTSQPVEMQERGEMNSQIVGRLDTRLDPCPTDATETFSKMFNDPNAKNRGIVSSDATFNDRILQEGTGVSALMKDTEQDKITRNKPALLQQEFEMESKPKKDLENDLDSFKKNATETMCSEDNNNSQNPALDHEICTTSKILNNSVLEQKFVSCTVAEDKKFESELLQTKNAFYEEDPHDETMDAEHQAINLHGYSNLFVSSSSLVVFEQRNVKKEQNLDIVPKESHKNEDETSRSREEFEGCNYDLLQTEDTFYNDDSQGDTICSEDHVINRDGNNDLLPHQFVHIVDVSSTSPSIKQPDPTLEQLESNRNFSGQSSPWVQIETEDDIHKRYLVSIDDEKVSSVVTTSVEFSPHATQVISNGENNELLSDDMGYDVHGYVITSPKELDTQLDKQTEELGLNLDETGEPTGCFEGENISKTSPTLENLILYQEGGNLRSITLPGESKDEECTMAKRKQETYKSSINGSNVKVNRNKWSEVLIIFPQTTNAPFKLDQSATISSSGILDSELYPITSSQDVIFITIREITFESKNDWYQKSLSVVQQGVNIPTDSQDHASIQYVKNNSEEEDYRKFEFSQDRALIHSRSLQTTNAKIEVVNVQQECLSTTKRSTNQESLVDKVTSIDTLCVSTTISFAEMVSTPQDNFQRKNRDETYVRSEVKEFSIDPQKPLLKPKDGDLSTYSDHDAKAELMCQKGTLKEIAMIKTDENVGGKPSIYIEQGKTKIDGNDNVNDSKRIENFPHEILPVPEQYKDSTVKETWTKTTEVGFKESGIEVTELDGHLVNIIPPQDEYKDPTVLHGPQTSNKLKPEHISYPSTDISAVLNSSTDARESSVSIVSEEKLESFSTEVFEGDLASPQDKEIPAHIVNIHSPPIVFTDFLTKTTSLPADSEKSSGQPLVTSNPEFLDSWNGEDFDELPPPPEFFDYSPEFSEEALELDDHSSASSTTDMTMEDRTCGDFATDHGKLAEKYPSEDIGACHPELNSNFYETFAESEISTASKSASDGTILVEDDEAILVKSFRPIHPFTLELKSSSLEENILDQSTAETYRETDVPSLKEGEQISTFSSNREDKTLPHGEVHPREIEFNDKTDDDDTSVLINPIQYTVLRMETNPETMNFPKEITSNTHPHSPAFEIQDLQPPYKRQRTTDQGFYMNEQNWSESTTHSSSPLANQDLQNPHINQNPSTLDLDQRKFSATQEQSSPDKQGFFFHTAFLTEDPFAPTKFSPDENIQPDFAQETQTKSQTPMVGSPAPGNEHSSYSLTDFQEKCSFDSTENVWEPSHTSEIQRPSSFQENISELSDRSEIETAPTNHESLDKPPLPSKINNSYYSIEMMNQSPQAQDIRSSSSNQNAVMESLKKLDLSPPVGTSAECHPGSSNYARAESSSESSAIQTRHLDWLAEKASDQQEFITSDINIELLNFENKRNKWPRENDIAIKTDLLKGHVTYEKSNSFEASINSGSDFCNNEMPHDLTKSLYRTTMDISIEKNQVSTCYVLLQQYSQAETRQTHIELVYDTDKWIVGAPADFQDHQVGTCVVHYVNMGRDDSKRTSETSGE